jgi:hypothetical protein
MRIIAGVAIPDATDREIMRHFLLEILAAILGSLIWLLGWPIFRDISLALAWISLLIGIGGLGFLIFLGIVVIQSIRQPPYET